MKHKKKYNSFIWVSLIGAVLTINVVSYLGAYGLTNYSQGNQKSWRHPRPENNKTPADFGLAYKSDLLKISQQEWIETWLIESSNFNPKGTVVLFHGIKSSKSSLLASAEVFHNLGYTTLLVDFRGSGGSSGNATTVGVRESQDVTLAMKYVKEKYPDSPVILYGISMGSAAILRAIAKQDIKPDDIIIELPFTSLVSAVKTRLSRAKIPTFPLGELMVFWGGVQNGFNGFAHQPINYAKNINCPTLILHGDLDDTVSFLEVENLYNNIDNSKNIVTFPHAKHQLLVTVNRQLWRQSVESFLTQTISN